jgi:hypothetical protein
VDKVSASIPAPKIAGPRAANPLVYKGIKYVARYASDKGMVDVFDAKTGEKLGELGPAYVTTYVKDLEQDVQWIFIKSLEVKNGKLLVKDTRGREHMLNLWTA